jgi:hypothetical protein
MGKEIPAKIARLLLHWLRNILTPHNQVYVRHQVRVQVNPSDKGLHGRSSDAPDRDFAGAKCFHSNRVHTP